MLGASRSALRARRLTLLPITLSVVALILWLANGTPAHSVWPAALLALAAAGMAASALVAHPLRLKPAARGEDLERGSAPEPTRVLIVGAGSPARRAAQELESSGDHKVIGFVSDVSCADSSCAGLLGTTADIPTLVRRLDVHQVIVA